MLFGFTGIWTESVGNKPPPCLRKMGGESICLLRPHHWVSWGHTAAGTCGKEMFLSCALDIYVIQYITPMCKKIHQTGSISNSMKI